MSRYCVNCGTELPDEAGFCPKCGTKIEVPCCPACGKEVDFDTDFCIYCGQPLKEDKKEPDVSDTSKVDDTVVSEAMPQEFSWSYKAALGRLETTVNTVTVRITEDIIRIFETQSSALSKKEPRQLPEKEVRLSSVESVRVCSHWSILFGVPLLLCIPLLLYGWLASRIDLMTAILCLAVVAVVAFRYSFQIHHHRLIITDHDNNRIALRGKDKLVLRQVEETIINRTGLTPHDQSKKRPALKIIGIVLTLLILIFAAFCAFEEIYLRRMYPKQIMLNPDVIAYAQTEINYHLAPDNYEITVEITGGDLTKRTAMPKYENGAFTYLFVDYIYDITVGNGTESVNGTVTVDASFEAHLFDSKPNDILFNTFTYSDNLESYIESLKAHRDDMISENLMGCWEFEYAEYKTGETASREEGNILYLRFYSDNSYLYTGALPSDSISSGKWQITDEKIVLFDDYDTDERVILLDGALLYLKKADKIVRYTKVSELPDYEASSDADGENVSDPLDSTFNFSTITGSWQDEAGENYLFIGYSDESRQDPRAYFTMAQGFEVLLSRLDQDSAEGVALDYLGDVAYEIGIGGYKYWLEVSLQDADTGETYYLNYFPADMENCPYDNPYYLDLS